MTEETTPKTFLDDFILICSHESPEYIGAWLLENATHMREDMFSKMDSSMMRELSPLHIMLLRAVTPNYCTFTEKSKQDFLKAVGEDRGMTLIADDVFQISDFIFAKRMPDEFRSQLIALMELVYRADIRPYDNRVIYIR